MDSKKIIISGINNKYQIKKLTQERKEEKQRSITQNWNISDIYYKFSKQLEIIYNIKNIFNNKEDYHDFHRIFIQELERKIYNYRQQDLIKSILNHEKFIKLTDIIDKLNECNLKCYYCNSEMFILYKNVRDPKQWTVDRINNSNGHNIDNIVLSCLECNLKRKNKNKDSFLFTKQLKIVRNDFNENIDVNNII
jgi:glutaredoxin-related protein